MELVYSYSLGILIEWKRAKKKKEAATPAISQFLLARDIN